MFFRNVLIPEEREKNLRTREHNFILPQVKAETDLSDVL